MPRRPRARRGVERAAGRRRIAGQGNQIRHSPTITWRRFSRIAREVRPAPNAGEALRNLETATAPALLVADAQLPPISALALYAQCSRLAVRPELIVTTCHHDAREADRARSAGALGYVTKPVRFRELLQLLHDRAEPAAPVAPGSDPAKPPKLR